MTALCNRFFSSIHRYFSLMLCLKVCLMFCLLVSLSSCGFHLQGEKQLAPPLHRMYLQTPDPYGQLAQTLKQYLKLSKVQLASSPQEAATILSILRDDTSEDLLSVSGTQLTRQYNLKVTVVFEITDPQGRILVNPQTLAESRVITVQSNQILGNSNEANLFYQQMRRTLAYSIINRIASKEITTDINTAFAENSKKH
jgi:LPS-assembly lipoprotein